ncbi:sensor histidine kinase [Psychrobacter sp. 1U1]|uniref:sensor histidine kinase n=2 Tax=unclassified Psychrobacter TaxID=196806 RepID=UPI003F46EF0D
MSISSSRNIPTIIRYSILQAIVVAVFAGFLLSFVYTFVHNYQQKRLHVQQLGEMLSNSASTPDGANLVARQVSILLDNDPSLQSILFYSTDQPIDSLSQGNINSVGNNWYNAWFADTVSFNYPVTSRYLTGSSIQRANSSQRIANTSPISVRDTPKMTTPLAARNTLVGYINITLDMNQLRWYWVRINLLSWFATTILAIFVVWYILRKLNWPTKDIVELAKVCEIAANDPELEQLPTIQQRFEFEELIRIKESFIILFERLRVAQQDYLDLADFEQQLHNKDLSLDMQRSNFQNMITHELKTSLNAITGGLQLLDNQYLNDEQKDTLAIIHKGSHHLELTLEQIIQLNRIEKGQMVVSLSEFNPLKMIADLIEKFEPAVRQKNLELISRVHHVEYTLEGDISKIQQILTTLVDNAIKFTHTGRVIIDSQLTHFNESIRWQVKVIDTGIGISTSHLEDIFTPFFQVDSSVTRENEGVGIGLSVIKQIGQLLGASIEVDSEIGVGSKFIVTMPLRYKSQTQYEYLLKDINVVYYHHNEISSMVEMLGRLGANVSSQRNGQSMMDYISKVKVNVIMFAEEVLPEQVVQLTKHIRERETTYRSLLVYWYPLHKEQYVESFEYDLKAAGIDYCHSAVQDAKLLTALLKKWVV